MQVFLGKINVASHLGAVILWYLPNNDDPQIKVTKQHTGEAIMKLWPHTFLTIEKNIFVALNLSKSRRTVGKNKLSEIK